MNNNRAVVQKKVNEIPLRLKIARISRGYKNKRVFALACEIPISTYRAHERGDNETKASDILYYATALDISVKWLLTGDGNPLEHKTEPTYDEIAKFEYHNRAEKLKYEFEQELEKKVAMEEP